MNILWLSHLIPYPPKGGVLQRTYNMVREVGKYHDITLVAFNQESLLKASLPGEEFPLAHAKDELLKHVSEVLLMDIPEDSIPGGRYLTALKAIMQNSSYNMEWLKSGVARRALRKLLSEKRFDAVHIDTISLCVYADIFRGIPIVLNHHNFESEMLNSRSSKEPSLFKRLYYRFEAARLLKSEIKWCRLVELNLTCSDDDAEAMQTKIGKGSYLTVPNGVDTSYFYPHTSITPIERSIVIVGGLSWYPNREAVEYFIRDIWPLLKSQVPGVKVDIVGRGPTDEMLRLAEADEFFNVHGFVDDVRDFLWSSQFYLCPIRTGGGTKLKILDALATGCCIIADPFACKGINVQNGIDVTFAHKPQDYVDSIQALLMNPEQQDNLRKAGPELIRKKYSYTGIGKVYSDALDQLDFRFQVEQRKAQ